MGANPWEEFLGSPYSESGWGCYAPVIAGALEQLLQDRDIKDLSVKELEGQSLESLCRAYVDRGVPVMLWATIEMCIRDRWNAGEAFQPSGNSR